MRARVTAAFPNGRSGSMLPRVSLGWWPSTTPPPICASPLLNLVRDGVHGVVWVERNVVSAVPVAPAVLVFVCCLACVVA